MRPQRLYAKVTGRVMALFLKKRKLARLTLTQTACYLRADVGRWFASTFLKVQQTITLPLLLRRAQVSRFLRTKLYLIFAVVVAWFVLLMLVARMPTW